MKKFEQKQYEFFEKVAVKASEREEQQKSRSCEDVRDEDGEVKKNRSRCRLQMS